MSVAIDVLIFSSGDLVFGVWTEQIEELLPGENIIYAGYFRKDYTLRHRQQDLRIIDFTGYLAQKSPQRMLLSTESAVLNRPGILTADHSFSLPKILVIKSQKRTYPGIHVENVIKLVTVMLDQIYPLPKIMEKQKHIPALWGLTFVDEKLVMLIDLTQLG